MTEVSEKGSRQSREAAALRMFDGWRGGVDLVVLLEPRAFPMPWCGLFVCAGELQEACLVEGLAQQLKAYRQAGVVFLCKDAWKSDTANPGEIRRDGENVREVHFKRVFGAFPHLECDVRRGRANDGVHFFESLFKILPDQCADFLSAQIVGVVVAA